MHLLNVTKYCFNLGGHKWFLRILCNPLELEHIAGSRRNKMALLL